MNDLDKEKEKILELLKTKRVLVICRGLPGSGKSTFAKQLLDDAMSVVINGMTICSADDYFLRPDGVYDWNPKYLKNAHEWCFNEVNYSMNSGDIWFDCELIVLDNTNILKSHYKKYLDLAKEMDYDVVEIVIGSFDDDFIKQCAERNTHAVPLETIQNMAKKFEV